MGGITVKMNEPDGKLWELHTDVESKLETTEWAYNLIGPCNV